MSSNKNFSTETSERYAKALLELSKENSELEKIENDARNFLEIYNSNNILENFIKNPTETFSNQLEFIEKISKIANFSKNFKNFLSILVIKRRAFFVKKIINNFLTLATFKKGKVDAKLVSSKSLTSEELKNINSELSKAIGSELNFDYKVNKDLIGGFKIQVGSLMIDTSIKNKLRKYEQKMLEN